MKKIISVSIVDDDDDLREQIAGYLTSAGNIRCQSAYASAEEALQHLPKDKPDVILIGTGSEVALCVEAYEKLKAEGVQARVVSMPSWKIFDNQDKAYKDSVLPPSVTARVSVEMAATFGWEHYVGLKGRKIGMHRFGASAPLKDLLKFFCFTTEEVVAEARKAIADK